MRVVALVATLILIAAVVIPVVILIESNSSSQASAMYTKSIQVAGNSAGFHYVSSWTGGGQPPLNFSGDAGQNDGSQTVTEPSDFGTEQYDLVLAPDQTLYFEGNAPALEDQLGVSASAAPGLAGSWIAVKIGDGPYKELEVGITVGSQLSEDSLVPSSSQQATESGATVTRISGTVPATQSLPAGTAHLDLSPSSDLPTTFVVSYDSASETSTTTFSGWGTAPSVTPPSSAVAWVSLSTASPPDGYGSGETPSPGPTPTPTPGGTA